ncbi:MAG TPA: pseudouridine synthase [Phycisphaerales bacterium]|nr:pseudouridine synthase [Phycisphaerales bacterium]HMP38350.1 pseudouridine synthase [Phycisphaerales bacterium]
MPRRHTHSFTDAARGERLQRVMADAGVGSRRHCEALIEAGAVSVNGEVVDHLPAWVDPREDRVVVGGRPLAGAPERHVYVLLHKPRGVVSTNDDPEGRPRAIDLVEHPARPRLFPVGRLDMDSSGLLLLTNDGDLAQRLTHPRFEVHKGYEVLVEGRLDDEEVRRLEAGIFLPERGRQGRRTSESTLTLIKRDRDRTLLSMELREGRNRQVRRMMLRLGHPVKKLKRVRLGPLTLKGVAIGAWRDLTARELSALRTAAGLGSEGGERDRSAGGGGTRGRSAGGRSTGGRGTGGRGTGGRGTGDRGVRARSAGGPKKKRRGAADARAG